VAKKKEIPEVLSKRGATAFELARNPGLDLKTAKETQRFIDDQLKLSGSISGDRAIVYADAGVGATARLSPSRSRFVLNFYNEQEKIRQEFVNAEIKRRFGPQGVTSQTTITNIQGQRAPVPGNPTINVPTPAQISEISSSFKTPLELIRAGLPANAQTRPASLIGKRPDPTIITGGGVKRKRLSGSTSRRTVLTSDTDSLLGGSTLLG